MSSQHSIQGDFAMVREAVEGWDHDEPHYTDVVAGYPSCDRCATEAALKRLEEQLETARRENARLGRLADDEGSKALASAGRRAELQEQLETAQREIQRLRDEGIKDITRREAVNTENERLKEQYQTALDRLWEAHDQLCGCDKPADEGRCSAPEETWGAFEYLGERERDPNPATAPVGVPALADPDTGVTGAAPFGEKRVLAGHVLECKWPTGEWKWVDEDWDMLDMAQLDTRLEPRRQS